MFAPHYAVCHSISLLMALFICKEYRSSIYVLCVCRGKFTMVGQPSKIAAFGRISFQGNRIILHTSKGMQYKINVY